MRVMSVFLQKRRVKQIEVVRVVPTSAVELLHGREFIEDFLAEPSFLLRQSNNLGGLS